MKPDLGVGLERTQPIEGLHLRENAFSESLDQQAQSTSNAGLRPLIREDLLGQIPSAEIVDQKPICLFLKREKDPVPLSEVDLFGKLDRLWPNGNDA